MFWCHKGASFFCQEWSEDVMTHPLKELIMRILNRWSYSISLCNGEVWAAELYSLCLMRGNISAPLKFSPYVLVGSYLNFLLPERHFFPWKVHLRYYNTICFVKISFKRTYYHVVFKQMDLSHWLVEWSSLSIKTEFCVDHAWPNHWT
jgi:hypothetical protein